MVGNVSVGVGPTPLAESTGCSKRRRKSCDFISPSSLLASTLASVTWLLLLFLLPFVDWEGGTLLFFFMLGSSVPFRRPLSDLRYHLSFQHRHHLICLPLQGGIFGGSVFFFTVILALSGL